MQLVLSNYDEKQIVFLNFRGYTTIHLIQYDDINSSKQIIYDLLVVYSHLTIQIRHIYWIFVYYNPLSVIFDCNIITDDNVYKKDKVNEIYSNWNRFQICL